MDQYSVLSTGKLVFMAVVVAASLAVWLAGMFIAARQPRDTSTAASSGPRAEETAGIASESGPRDESRPRDESGSQDESRPSDKAAA